MAGVIQYTSTISHGPIKLSVSGIGHLVDPYGAFLKVTACVKMSIDSHDSAFAAGDKVYRNATWQRSRLAARVRRVITDGAALGIRPSLSSTTFLLTYDRRQSQSAAKILLPSSAPSQSRSSHCNAGII